MNIEYLELESPHKRGKITLKIEDEHLSFNHTLIHKKEEYEDFGVNDYGIEIVKNHKIFHINGHVITFNEYKFVHSTIIDHELK